MFNKRDLVCNSNPRGGDVIREKSRQEKLFQANNHVFNLLPPNLHRHELNRKAASDRKTSSSKTLPVDDDIKKYGVDCKNKSEMISAQ